VWARTKRNERHNRLGTFLPHPTSLKVTLTFRYFAMRPLGCLSLLAIAVLLAPGAWAESSDAPQGSVSHAAPIATSATPAGETEALPVEVPRAERASEASRPRSSEALMRALILISSAGGGRPFPLVPR
jgi:hypothetical protein